MCQATTPDGVSSQDTPSSGVVNMARCWKLMMPKTMAARVARARTAAPNRILRLSLIGALNWISLQQLIDKRKSVQLCFQII